MNGYQVFYRNLKVEVEAETSYGAQQKALQHFSEKFPKRKIKGNDLTVVLCDKDRKNVVHFTGEL